MAQPQVALEPVNGGRARVHRPNPNPTGPQETLEKPDPNNPLTPLGPWDSGSFGGPPHLRRIGMVGSWEGGRPYKGDTPDWAKDRFFLKYKEVFFQKL